MESNCGCPVTSGGVYHQIGCWLSAIKTKEAMLVDTPLTVAALNRVELLLIEIRDSLRVLERRS